MDGGSCSFDPSAPQAGGSLCLHHLCRQTTYARNVGMHVLTRLHTRAYVSFRAWVPAQGRLERGLLLRGGLGLGRVLDGHVEGVLEEVHELVEVAGLGGADVRDPH